MLLKKLQEKYGVVADHDSEEKWENFVYDAAKGVKDLWIKTADRQMSPGEFDRLRDELTNFFSDTKYAWFKRGEGVEGKAKKEKEEEGEEADAAEKWIQKAINPAHKGDLAKKLGKSKKTGKIPVEKLKKAAHQKGKTGKQARLALTLRKLKK